MTRNFLVKLFEHNNCANNKIIQACSTLSDKQLDAEPQSATKGNIRRTLSHLVTSQRGYLALLTLPVDARPNTPVAFAELQESARISGDGFFVEPWVVMVQVINHATEHREQIKSMLSALGVTPPEIDGWDYGFVTGTLTPITT